jgi:signal transduction histidine kinase
MRLKTKLVLSVTALTFAIVLVLSAVFATELLRQGIEQTAAANDVLAREVWLMTRQAVEAGTKEHPPVDRSEEALHAAVVDALRINDALKDVMNAVVRYSPTVQDVSVTDAHGLILVSTDPDSLGQQSTFRTNLNTVRYGGVVYQTRQVFGQPRVLDLTQALDRNGSPFLIVHVGVRSTFLRNSYTPWLRAALVFALIAGFASIVAAGLLANLALLPIEQISRRLERLTQAGEMGLGAEDSGTFALEAGGEGSDAVVRVTKTIDRLGEQMRTKAAGYTALQANLNQMLDTLRDGVLLFTADRLAVMVSDAVENFVSREAGGSGMVGLRLEEIFAPETALGAAVLEAFASGREVMAESVTLEDGREVQISLDRIHDSRMVAGQDGAGSMGTLLTLRDTESAMQLGQELEVSRRLAAIGRLTAGVGHEVKNPINAMVVHLELLRGKLASGAGEENELFRGAQRHVEILSGEMQRLDRVVQTLADFSRPMELHLHEQDLRGVVNSVVELTGFEMAENNVQVTTEMPRDAVMVRVDGEQMRQALLNLMLNGMQAMPEGGSLRVVVRREGQFALVEVVDAGEGIAAEVLPRIFELYFTTKPKGSGIGLATTYRILQMHGGAMEVRSIADEGSAERGTTFTLRVPVAVSGEGRKAGVAGRVEAGQDAGLAAVSDLKGVGSVGTGLHGKESV